MPVVFRYKSFRLFFIQTKVIHVKPCTSTCVALMGKQNSGLRLRCIWRIVMVLMPVHCVNCEMQ